MSVNISIFFIICSFLPKVNDYLFLVGWVVTLLNLYSIYNRKQYFNVIDILILCYLIYDFISIFTGINRMPVLLNFINTYTVITVYFICRFNFYTSDSIKKCILYISLFGSLLAILNVPSFLKVYENIDCLNMGGFISDFKFLITPLGLSMNEWSSFILYIFILLNLAIVLYFNNRKVLLFLLTGYASSFFLLINSFSRGIYICLVVYLIFAAVFILISKFRFKIKALSFIFVSGVIAFSSFFYFEDVEKTLKMNETISQNRSWTGRLNSIDIGWKIFREKPIVGVGTGNFSYAHNFYFQKNDMSVSFTGNILSQLFAEKGLCGGILFICLFLKLISLVLVNKILLLKPEQLIIFVFYIVFILRELSFPCFFSNISIQFIFLFFIVVTFFYFPANNLFTFGSRVKLIISLLLIFLSIMTTSFLYRKQRDSIINRNVVEAINNGEFFLAQNYMQSSKNNFVRGVNMSIIYWNLYKKYNNINYLHMAERHLLSCIQLAPSDYILKYNLAKVYESMSCRSKSDSLLSDLVEKYPNKTLFKFYNVTRNVNLYHELPKVLIENPDILFSHNTDCLFSKLQVSPLSISNAIKALSDSVLLYDDPILYAKYGKALLWSGDTLAAKKNLENSLEILPNLIEPRYKLSLIENHYGNVDKSKLYLNQYIFLNKGQIKHNEMTCFDYFYYYNFEKWYGGIIPIQYFIF